MKDMRFEAAAVVARLDELQLRPQPRDDHRPVADYPTMPPGTCHTSSRILAACYPELEMRTGRVEFRVGDRLCGVDHCWNVTPDGYIVDSTLRLPADVKDVAYHEGSVQ